MDSTPKIYLFLSTDIIGSTSLKYSHSKKDAWQRLIYRFYNNFTDQFNANLKLKKKEYNIPKPSKVNPWKYSGDEVIYFAQISDSNEILMIIDAFSDTLAYMNTNTENDSMFYKGTSWVCQVPFIDIEFKNDKSPIDFIGPSMDCGFRLGKYSTKEYITISIELAYLIAATCKSSKSSHFKNKIIFNGREQLKGVLGQFKYPIFSIEVNIQYPEKEIKNEIKHTQIIDYINTLKKADLDLKRYKENVVLIEADIKSYLATKENKSKEIATQYPEIADISKIKAKVNSKNGSKKSFNQLKSKVAEIKKD